MKILINCYDMPLAEEGSGGAGKYVQGLIPGLAEKSDAYIICSKHNAKEYQFLSAKQILVIDNFEDMDIEKYCKSVDIYFNPSNNLAPKYLPKDIPIVTIIHDLQHNYYPHFFQNGLFEARNIEYGYGIARCDGLVVVSDWEKSNFEKYFMVKNIQTINHAPYLYEKKIKHKKSQYNDNKKLSSFSSYFLYPAVSWPHKNHYRLIEAFAILNRKYPTKEFNLILTGASHVDSTSLLYKKIKDLNCNKFIKTLGYVTDDDLITLMSNAKGMVFPSLYEGFGIPLIDAMNFGLPIIASNITAIPETTGGFVEYFRNPYDSYEIASDILNFDEKINQGSYDIEKAKKFASKYSTEHMVSEYLHYFEAVIKSKEINDPYIASFSTKPTTSNLSTQKVTIIVDLDEVSKLQDVKEFFEKLISNANPEIFDYALIMSYKLRDNLDDDIINKINKIATCAYYTSGILTSKIIALEHLLEIYIKTDYFICLTVSQFNNLNYSFIRKGVAYLDYFRDIYSCINSNEKHSVMKIVRPPKEEKAIRDFNETLSKGDLILMRFYNRLIRTRDSKNQGMVGTTAALSKDTSTFSNIVI